MTALASTASNVISGYKPEKMLLKGKNRNSVLLVSKNSQKVEIINLLIKKLFKIIMSKIRLQQNQKLIMLQKILVANLLCFKVTEIKRCLFFIHATTTTNKNDVFCKIFRDVGS